MFSQIYIDILMSGIDSLRGGPTLNKGIEM